MPALLTSLLIWGAPLSVDQPGVPTEPVVDANGAVTVQVFTLAAPDTVRQLIADPRARGALQPSILSVEVLGQEGGCTRLRTTTEGLTSPFVYDSRACPTANGWRDTLLESPDLSAYETVWTLTPRSGGTEVSYRCHIEVKIPVPNALVRRGTSKSMVGTLLRLVERLK